MLHVEASGFGAVLFERVGGGELLAALTVLRADGIGGGGVEGEARVQLGGVVAEAGESGEDGGVVLGVVEGQLGEGEALHFVEVAIGGHGSGG